MSDDSKEAIYEFGPFRLDTARRLLLRHGEPVHLSPKAFDILVVLAKSNGHVLEREELLKTIWPDCFVEQINLTVHISALRKALGETSNDHQYILTIHGQGYRFAADVTRVQDDYAAQADANSDAHESAVGEEKSNKIEQSENEIAERRSPVVIFRNRSLILKALRAELKLKRHIRVFFRNRALMLKALAFSVPVIILATALYYDWISGRPQQQASRTPARSIGVSAKNHTENPEAYQSYLKGRYFWNKRTAEGLKKSISYFEEAIGVDPHYALAHVGKADAYSLMTLYQYGELPAQEYISRAKAAALRALTEDEGLAEAHASLANIRLLFDYDLTGAAESYERAIKLDPDYATAHHWYGITLTLMGRYEQGLAELRRALEIEPLSLMINTALGMHFFISRQYDEAIAAYHKVLEMDERFVQARIYLGAALMQKRMFEQAIAELEKAQAHSRGSVQATVLLGCAYALGGKAQAAKRILYEMEEQSKKLRVSSYDMAMLYAVIGNEDEALKRLNKAYEERSGRFVFAKADPIFDSIRTNPEFVALLERAGIAQ